MKTLEVNQVIIPKPLSFLSKMASKKISELSDVFFSVSGLASIVSGFFMGQCLETYTSYSLLICCFVFVTVTMAAPYLYGNYFKTTNHLKAYLLVEVFSLFMLVGNALLLKEIGLPRFGHQISFYDEANLKDKNFMIGLDASKMPVDVAHPYLTMKAGLATPNFDGQTRKWFWKNGDICFENGCLALDPETGDLSFNGNYFGRLYEVSEIAPITVKDQTYQIFFKKD